jgi:hypothetical protein
VPRSTLLLLTLTAAFASAQTPLFNGRDLTGWVAEGAFPFASVHEGALRISGTAMMPHWVHTEREYADFHLTFDYKLDQWAEAAVLLRAARSDRPQHTGLALVLTHDFHHDVTPQSDGGRMLTGAILAAVPPRAALAESWGAWHHADITLQGTRLRALIDRVVVQDLDTASVPALAARLRRGVIGFPDMGYGYELRNLQIEELGAGVAIEELTPGDALKGWDKRGDSGIWSEDAGVLSGAYGHSILYAPPTVRDFELTAIVRSHDRVNSGIFVRGDPAGERRGFEIQIYSPVDSVYPTGSIYGRVRSRVSADYEARWFLMQIRVEGARCRVWLDGELAAETNELPPELQRAGRIGFQIHSDNARVEFRDIRLRRLEP